MNTTVLQTCTKHTIKRVFFKHTQKTTLRKTHAHANTASTAQASSVEHQLPFTPYPTVIIFLNNILTAVCIMFHATVGMWMLLHRSNVGP
jgi:hypothetical protein